MLQRGKIAAKPAFQAGRCMAAMLFYCMISLT